MRFLLIPILVAATTSVAMADNPAETTSSANAAAKAMMVNRTAAMFRLSVKQLDQDKINGAPAEVIAQDEASVQARQAAFKKAANLD